MGQKIDLNLPNFLATFVVISGIFLPPRKTKYFRHFQRELNKAFLLNFEEKYDKKLWLESNRWIIVLYNGSQDFALKMIQDNTNRMWLKIKKFERKVFAEPRCHLSLSFSVK